MARMFDLMVGLLGGLFVFLPRWMSKARRHSAECREELVQMMSSIVAGEGEAGRREGEEERRTRGSFVILLLAAEEDAPQN